MVLIVEDDPRYFVLLLEIGRDRFFDLLLLAGANNHSNSLLEIEVIKVRMEARQWLVVIK